MAGWAKWWLALSSREKLCANPLWLHQVLLPVFNILLLYGMLHFLNLMSIYNIGRVIFLTILIYLASDSQEMSRTVIATTYNSVCQILECINMVGN